MVASSHQKKMEINAEMSRSIKCSNTILQILDKKKKKKTEDIEKENRGNVYFIDVKIFAPFWDTQYGVTYMELGVSQPH